MKHFIPLIVSVLIALAAGAGYFYMFSTIRAAATSAASARDEIAAEGQREAFARTAAAFLEDTAESREELGSFVAEDADFVSVIETVEATARREGVTASVGAVTVRADASKFHERVAMTLSVTGPFSDVAAFIAALELFPVASRVTNVSLEATTQGNWFGTIMLEFVKRKSAL